MRLARRLGDAPPFRGVAADVAIGGMPDSGGCDDPAGTDVTDLGGSAIDAGLAVDEAAP